MRQTDSNTFRGLAAWLLCGPMLLGAALVTPAEADELVNDRANAQAEAILTCDSRATIIADLKNGYSEQPTALGVTNAGTVMELWTATGGDTWTLIVTLTNGNSCVIGAGDDWTSIQKTAKGKIL